MLNEYDEIGIHEAAQDLLDARKRLGYAVMERHDLWKCLEECTTTPPTTNDAIPAGEVERLRAENERLREDTRAIQRNTAVYRQEARKEVEQANARAAEADRRASGVAEASRRMLAAFEVDAAALSAAPSAPATEAGDIAWLSGQRRLSLSFYSPMYGDDDDQSEEWRVHKESGQINDREWDIVGRGATVADAVRAARAALSATPTDQVKDAGKGGGE